MQEKWLTLVDSTLNSIDCWIDPKGNFYPVKKSGHNDLIETLYGLGMPSSNILGIENSWVKISTSIGIAYSKPHIITWGIILTGKQQITLQKWLLQHQILDLTKKGDEIEIGRCGYMVVLNGKLKFIKHNWK